MLNGHVRYRVLQPTLSNTEAKPAETFCRGYRHHPSVHFSQQSCSHEGHSDTGSFPFYFFCRYCLCSPVFLKSNVGIKCIFRVFVTLPLRDLCEILLVEAKKVLLNIIVIRKNLICIYFQHTFTFATTKLVSSIDLVSW